MDICMKCVLPSCFPGIQLDDHGICNYCRQSQEESSSRAIMDFKNENELIECLSKHRIPGRKYDVLVPLSGGVDSCNVLITIVEKYHLKALGFHNDHGYEDETAGINVKKLCKKLNVDLVIMQQDMEFMKKLWRYIGEADVKGLNSCYVCGNILYLNAIEVAHRFKIPLVINGYSKGQASQINDMEKGRELLETLVDIITKTGDDSFYDDFMRKYEILDKRIPYKTKKDLEKNLEPDKILFLPFYIFDFYKIDKNFLKEKIKGYFDWQPIKSSYPNRTTNCEMIWLNTYMDLKKMGYSNYHIEYAELIRRGEITREQAIKDLKFIPPDGIIEKLAQEIGLDLDHFDKKKWCTDENSENKTVTVDFNF